MRETSTAGGAEPPTGARRRSRRRGRRVLLAAIVLLLVPVVAVGGYLVYLNKIVTDNIRHEDLLGTPKSLDVPTGNPGAGDGDVIGPGGTKPAYAAGQVVDGRGDDYLVIGSDARPGDTFSRSDVIVLVHVSADHQKVTLVHFPRDLYVAIPGRGNNKINAAYAFGGAPLLVRTIENLVGVRIGHVAKTDFNGFKNMIDAVGGIRVWAEEGSDGGNGGDFVIRKGWNDLDGTQALGFVRERYALSEGDISRGRRQLAVVKALILKTVSRDVLLNPGRLASFVDAATSNLTVDNALSVGTMRSEAFQLRGVRSGDIGFVTAPFTGYAFVSGAGSVDVVDEDGMQQLGEALRTDTLGSYADQHTTP